MKLTLRQLAIFRAIAQHGSTTRASAVLCLSQSATSAALHELEHALGAPLFDRAGKRLVLNANGQGLLPQALRLLEAAAQIEDGFEHAAIGGRLRVGCSTTIGNYLMPGLMKALAQRAPKVQVDVIMGNSADIARHAAQLSIDLGLIEGPCHLPDLSARHWCDDELLIVAAAEDPLARQAKVKLPDLACATWLLREPGSGTAEQVSELLLPHLKHWPHTQEVGSSEAIKHMVAAGLGISCLSRWVVADLIARGQLVALRHELPTLTRPFYQVHHRDKFVSRAMEAFLDVLQGFSL
jgi:DNA-binding transcriptional LysR family regulator